MARLTERAAVAKAIIFTARKKIACESVSSHLALHPNPSDLALSRMKSS